MLWLHTGPHSKQMKEKIIKEKWGLYMSKNISCLFISACEVPSHGPITKKEPASHHFLQSVHLPAHDYEYSVL